MNDRHFSISPAAGPSRKKKKKNLENKIELKNQQQ